MRTRFTCLSSFLVLVLATALFSAPITHAADSSNGNQEAWSIDQVDPLDKIDCPTMIAMGIEKAENFRAYRIQVKCGLEFVPTTRPWSKDPDRAYLDRFSPLALGGLDLNLITGATDPYPSVTESESAVWGNGSTIFSAFNTSPGATGAGGSYGHGSYSTDGGATFTRLNPNPFATGHSQNYGDPMVVYNAALAKWYVAFLATGCGGQGIGMWESTDAVTWTTGACAHNGSSDDRESMWVDNNPGSPHYGRMYISYNDFAIAGGALYVVYSDNGTTWNTALVYNGGTFHRNVQVTGSPDTDGTVFIASMDEGGGGSGNRTNLFYRSTDGGVTWANSWTGTPFAAPGSGLCPGGGYFYMTPPIWRYMGWGQPAVGPANTVHYVYSVHGAASDYGDIYYIRSTDNGTTFSAPLKLNQDATTYAQWMPSLTATSTGQVLASWFDRRNSAGGNNYEFYGRTSYDAGVTWQTDDVISDTISPQPLQPDPAIQACYVGDYNYHSTNGTSALVTWVDGRVQIAGNNQQDVFFDSVQLCATLPDVPSGVTATATAPNEITVSWSPAAGADCYDVYSNFGACPGSNFVRVSTCQAGTSYVDTTVSGGSTYAYKVQSVISANGCRSAFSTCSDAAATGTCTLPPAFAGLVSVTNTQNATCALDLAWAAATSNCSAAVTYNIYRDTTSPFPPSPANLIASGVTGTSYSDSGIGFGTTYYYIVRAVDSSNAQEETNTVIQSGTPTGPISTALLETFEAPGGFDNPGWTHNPISGTQDWAWSTAQSHSPTHSWFAADISTVSDKVIVTPSLSVSPASTLSFWHTYAFENPSTCYDGGTLQITTNGGSTWTVLPDAAFLSGGFTGNVSTCCSNPIGGLRAWCNGSIGAMTEVVVDLSAYAGSTAKLRWHEGDDSSISSTGWYVDDVTVQTAAACAGCGGITVGPATLPDGTVGTPYNQTITATGGAPPYTFSASGVLPAGLTLDPNTGVISGTPTATGSFNFTIVATDTNGCAGSQSYTVNIVCPVITVSPATLPDGVAGTAYSQTVSASGGAAPYTFAVSAGSLPNGLALNANTGAISGTPTLQGTFNFTITATDADGCTGSQAYTVNITCPAIAVNPATLPDGNVGVAYSATVSGSGGAAPYTFAVSTGSLPNGLTLNATTGAISGTPTVQGTFNFTVAATDSHGCSGSQAYAVTINVCPAITVNPATLPNGTVGAAYSATVSGSGGAAPYTFAVSAGSLPSGLTLNATTGNITGTPAVEGTSNFTITATDANGCAGSQGYTVVTGPACLYCNEFDAMPNYDIIKPAWSVSNSVLQGTPAGRKAIAAATPEFAGCLVCTATTSMATAGGSFNKISFYNHFVDKNNLVELLMKQETGKWILKQRINKKVVAKAKFVAPINPNQFYTVDVAFDGTQFVVTIDGAPAMTMVPVGVIPTGTVGFAAKNTTGSWEYIHVN